MQFSVILKTPFFKVLLRRGIQIRWFVRHCFHQRRLIKFKFNQSNKNSLSFAIKTNNIKIKKLSNNNNDSFRLFNRFELFLGFLSGEKKN